MDPNIVVLAGGRSSRMNTPASGGQGVELRLRRRMGSQAKSMLGVGRGERPFMDYILLNVARSGYRDVVIVVGDEDDSIRERYEDRGGAAEFPDLRLTFVQQPIPAGRTKPLGTADALYRALAAMPRWRGSKCTVCNSDNLYSLRALRLLLQDTHAGAMIDYDRSALKFPPERFAHFSVITKDAGGFLREITEKPSPEEVAAAADAGGRVGVSMNIFRFTCDVISPFLEGVPLHPVRNEQELPVAVRNLVHRDPRAMYTIPLSEHVIDLTSPEDIPHVRSYLEEHFPEF
jgi:NDP-sugar pyrophosphorylase family protein